MRNNVKDIKNDDKLLVKADKTTNFYKLSTSQYRELIKQNITKDYKKDSHDLAKSITTKDIIICQITKPRHQNRSTSPERSFYYIKRAQT